jgi:serine/threonine kinase 32
VFPEDGEDLNEDLLDLISKFCTREIKYRLGTKENGGMDKIRSHPFFKDVDWKQIETKTAVPEFVPDVNAHVLF